MATIPLPPDFSEFLRLLNESEAARSGRVRAVTRRGLFRTIVGSLLAPTFARAQELKRGPTVHDHIRELAANAPLKMRFRGGTADGCREWQSGLRTKLGELLGPHRPPSAWKVTVENSAEFEDHRRESLILEAEGHPALPLYLLTPKSPATQPRPAVLALHGHGPLGHDPVAGVDASDEHRKQIADFNYDYGRQLVRRGYVVAAPCFTPFGRRLDDPKAYGGDDACAVAFVRLQLLGKVLMAENLRDALWAFELLRKREDVAPDRIACVGLSYGGRMTMLTAAMEPRIRAAVCSGSLNLMQERIGGRYSCGAQVIPGLLEYGDVPEIGGLIAPRPCVWEIGSKDRLMVKQWIDPALERIRRAYDALGAGDQLEVDRFDGGHQWSGRLGYPMLKRTLAPV